MSCPTWGWKSRVWGLTSIPFMRLLSSTTEGSARGCACFGLPRSSALQLYLYLFFIFYLHPRGRSIAYCLLSMHNFWVSPLLLQPSCCQQQVCRVRWCSALPNLRTLQLLPCSSSSRRIVLGFVTPVYGKRRYLGRAFSCFVALFANEGSVF